MIVRKNSEIQQMPDGAVIESFRGTAKRVMDPDTPSDAQALVGISPQSILMDVGDGDTWVRLNHKDIHIPKSAQGTTYIFESTTSPTGETSGLFVNRYYSKKLERDVCSIDVRKEAHFYEDKSGGNGVVVPQEQKQAMITAAAASQSASPFALAHWQKFLGIVTQLIDPTQQRMFGDALKEAIFADRDNIPGVVPQVLIQPQTEKPLPYDADLTFKGERIANLGVEKLLGGVLLTSGYEGEGDKNAAIRDALQEHAKDLGWEKLYDELVKPLMDKHGTDVVNDAYDTLKQKMGIVENEDLCRNIVLELDPETKDPVFFGIVDAIIASKQPQTEGEGPF